MIFIFNVFFFLQWEALALLLIGICVNQLRTLPEGSSAMVPVATGAYLYTLIFVSILSTYPVLIWIYLVPVQLLGILIGCNYFLSLVVFTFAKCPCAATFFWMG